MMQRIQNNDEIEKPILTTTMSIPSKIERNYSLDVEPKQDTNQFNYVKRRMITHRIYK
jgi:hypothetical protein